MAIIKDFVRLIFGLPDDEPVSNLAAIVVSAGFIFICTMLAIFLK